MTVNVTPRDATPPRVLEALAAIAHRMRIEHRHPREQFVELWVDGRMLAYCRNLGTAAVVGAAHLGIDAKTFTDAQGRLACR